MAYVFPKVSSAEVTVKVTQGIDIKALCHVKCSIVTMLVYRVAYYLTRYCLLFTYILAGQMF